MAALKPVILGKFTKKDGTANIKIRLTHGSRSKYFATQFYIDPKFMSDSGRISTKHPSAGKMNIALNNLLNKYNNFLLDFGDGAQGASLDQLYNYIVNKEHSGGSFLVFLNDKVARLQNENRTSYAELHKATIKLLNGFTGGGDIQFSDINQVYLKRFDEYLKQVGNSTNSRRIHLSNIRATYFNALDDGLVQGAINPFRGFKIRGERGVSRPMEREQMRAMLAFPARPNQALMRDLFMLSFYLIGINFKDMINLKNSDLKDGRVSFFRFKTKRRYSIKVEPEAMEIIERHRGKVYLLNVAENKRRSPDRQALAHRDIVSQANKRLGQICGGADISTYTARYSWATYAAKIGISRDVIAHALGHGVNTVTDLYIDFGQEKVDEANRKVIDYLVNGG